MASIKSSMGTSPSGALNKKQFSLTGRLLCAAILVGGTACLPSWAAWLGVGLVSCSLRCTLVYRRLSRGRNRSVWDDSRGSGGELQDNRRLPGSSLLATASGTSAGRD
ncbi:hypothetical protein MTO96_029514 [Rhipicephalus appendiculatus]